jgi:hypothetical protein
MPACNDKGAPGNGGVPPPGFKQGVRGSSLPPLKVPHGARRSQALATEFTVNLKFTGLTQNLGQL